MMEKYGVEASNLPPSEEQMERLASLNSKLPTPRNSQEAEEQILSLLDRKDK